MYVNIYLIIHVEVRPINQRLFTLGISNHNTSGLKLMTTAYQTFWCDHPIL